MGAEPWQETISLRHPGVREVVVEIGTVESRGSTVERVAGLRQGAEVTKSSEGYRRQVTTLFSFRVTVILPVSREGRIGRRPYGKEGNPSFRSSGSDGFLNGWSGSRHGVPGTDLLYRIDKLLFWFGV